MIIAIDGYSGTGKSTLAKLIATKLGFNYLNTGMIYRGITYYLLENNVSPLQIDKIETILQNANIEIKYNGLDQFVFINGVDLTKYVSTTTVQKFVSEFATLKCVRICVLNLQHKLANNYNFVVDGRDIGTGVFPNAEYKFFISCDTNIRAQRRLNDLTNNGINISLNEVIESFNKRDFLDTTRELSPLKKADDAISIDTSNSTIEESLTQMLNYINY